MSDSRYIIQARLLASIDDSYNKSEGEFIYDAEKPVSIELEGAYTQIDGLLDKAFADTATGKNLDRVVARAGIIRKTTTRATGTVTITGVAGSAITVGQLVASDSLNFEFLETTTVPASGSIDISVRCTTYGTVGNVAVGAIKFFPKTLSGLQGVANKETFSNGTDEESDEELKVRYYAKVNSNETTANKAAFKSWALSVDGVGSAKVIPLWNGAGTVKVLVINSEMKVADSTLVKSVQDYIDPNENGDGSGVMPLCGAVCTVASATEKLINVNVTIQTTLDSNDAQSKIESAITEYLQSIAFEQNYVSYQMIGNKILNIEGITDSSLLTVNGGTSNIMLEDTEVAVLGVVTIG
ncbi:baseplate J/gp47 family protein [Clostridium sp.]|uniref:baseplate J/gp47 family protein n=1 Tax=Clostridium sp. TaxID=1506 RepID=UPI00260B5BF4|nr:baseplate J/gp47 family protein [Clostridium sp.]